MKAIGRNDLWRPGLDKERERITLLSVWSVALWGRGHGLWLCRERRSLLPRQLAGHLSCFHRYNSPHMVFQRRLSPIMGRNSQQRISKYLWRKMESNIKKLAPYHPASNGAAERSAQILTKSLEKQKMDGRQRIVTEIPCGQFLIEVQEYPALCHRK